MDGLNKNKNFLEVLSLKVEFLTNRYKWNAEEKSIVDDTANRFSEMSQINMYVNSILSIEIIVKRIFETRVEFFSLDCQVQNKNCHHQKLNLTAILLIGKLRTIMITIGENCQTIIPVRPVIDGPPQVQLHVTTHWIGESAQHESQTVTIIVTINCHDNSQRVRHGVQSSILC